MFGEVKRRQWIMFKRNLYVYTYPRRHIYISYIFHIKIHKLTAITISLSWFIHKPKNMSHRVHTTGGFILFYCVSCLHKNVVKHALFFSSPCSFGRSFYVHHHFSPLLPNTLSYTLMLQKKSAWLCLITLLLIFETHFALVEFQMRIDASIQLTSYQAILWAVQKKKKLTPSKNKNERKLLESFKHSILVQLI